MNIKQTLLDLCAPSGIAGDENEAAAHIARLLEPFGGVMRNPLGSVICRVWEAAPGQPHLLLDAHLDEVGLIVTHIEDSGFLRVGGCGGIDRRALPASPVIIHGKKGKINGVICSSPPHLEGGKEKKFAPVDELYIDIGHTKEQAQRLISPGDRVSLNAPSRQLLGDKICGKALDNRAGCVSLLYALELLRDVQPGCGLSVIFSTLEETGGQGAKTAAHQLRPTHAVVVDTSFAHTPDSAKTKCGIMGKGPMIGVAPILSREMADRLIRVAEAQSIPYQHEVMAGPTGANADHIAATRAGVATGLVSIPLKYMHTPVECAALPDIENTGRLLAAFVKDFAAERGGAQ